MGYSQTPPLEPIVPAYHVRILSDEQLAQFEAATLELLAETGVHCPSRRALSIFQETLESLVKGLSC